MFLSTYTRVNAVTMFVEGKTATATMKTTKMETEILTAKDAGSRQTGILKTNKINFISVGAA
jgi:hypothetical protein